MKYLAISNHAWAAAKTLKQAKIRLLQAGGTVTGITIYLVPDDYRIDELGRAFGSGEAKLISGQDYRF